MRERGMDKANLRPALLLMAQCHHSLAQQNRDEPEGKEGSDRHFVVLLDWLRETYGPNTPAMDAILQSGSRAPYAPQNGAIDELRSPTLDRDSLRNVPGLFETHNSAESRASVLSLENAALREKQKVTFMSPFLVVTRSSAQISLAEPLQKAEEARAAAAAAGGGTKK